MVRRAPLVFLAVSAVLTALLAGVVPAHAAPVTVTNATQFTDTTGALVHAHGGGVIKVGSYYYWFGENRNADNTFRYVSAYRSTDLRTWEFRNHVLTQATDPELAVAKIERPKVMFNSATGKYVMWMHKENGSDYSQARAAVAVSDTVDGDYAWRGSFRPLGHMSRDITVFTDDNGAGYMISSARNNYDLHIYRLTADYQGIGSLVANPWPGGHREAPAMFKRNGVYFMLTSGATGWNPNQQQYATATSPAGPWTAMADVGDHIAYGSQTAYVLPVQGTSGTSYLYLGDRWGNSMGGTVSDSQYVWLPLAFPTSRTMTLPWYPQISIDTSTGAVTGVGGGPYHHIIARHSGKCVDVSDNSATNGAAILQYTCDSDLNQQWRLQDAGGGYHRILAQHSGKCLDVSDAATTNGARVIQWTCGSGSNQQWRLDDLGNGYHRLVARHSGKCLDVSDNTTTNGARLIQWTCGTGANQQFQRHVA
ncbi:beta-xylosidase [Micromonospora sp. KC606]|uniref:RICIN domain-containing protein n=1 Tax=Micromonospora sp. KC606 TaxID=2530379 RepID=UPI0010508279|nr:RICIN domain-containing protein [Micromonospora sp. KC606]TDC80916.1 beta-xylosidase [Micromonospora sp. KC606]